MSDVQDVPDTSAAAESVPADVASSQAAAEEPVPSVSEPAASVAASAAAPTPVDEPASEPAAVSPEGVPMADEPVAPSPGMSASAPAGSQGFEERVMSEPATEGQPSAVDLDTELQTEVVPGSEATPSAAPASSKSKPELPPLDPVPSDLPADMEGLPESPAIPPPQSPQAVRMGSSDWEAKCRQMEQRSAALERLLLLEKGQKESRETVLQAELEQKTARIKRLESSVQVERKEKGALGGELDKQKELNRQLSVCKLKRKPSKMERRGSAQAPSNPPSTSAAPAANDAVLSDIIAAKLKDTLDVVKEKDRIIQNLMRSQVSGHGGVSPPAPTPFGSELPAPAGGEQQAIIVQARDCINDLKRVISEKDVEIATLKSKLANAQNAIMTNVDGIAELDSKLQQSRKALRWLLRANQMAPSSSRSPSPMYGAGARAPQLPPAYNQAPVYSSPTQQYATRGYSASPAPASPQANLGQEQLQALRELETMLAAREAAQRQAYPAAPAPGMKY